jgi:outer membrane protein OmpA-like peptidoglycan-associated protein
MLPTNTTIKKLAICILMVMLTGAGVNAQTTLPTWWYGVSGAANFNFYGGTTQTLNNSLIVPTAFHRGQGVSPYGSLLVEYRPAGVFGLMLNVGYDGRGAKFNNEIAPCDCPATLKTSVSYATIEPSLRLSVPASGLYFYVGPRVGFNINKDFSYTQLHQPNTNAEFSNIQSTVFSGQVGMGYDIMVSSAASTTKVSLSPFISYQPYFGQEPRTIETWTVTTIRAGIALKFGKGHKAPVKIADAPLVIAPSVTDVSFSVVAPAAAPSIHLVSETLPLNNSVFFDEKSSEIPNRYIILTKNQASGFNEVQLQNEQSDNMTGRSARQLNIYHNILNILGDRLRANPSATISLIGSSYSGPMEGKARAESIKTYLVSAFGIDPSRITVVGRTKPVIPSDKPGNTKQLTLVRAEDRRVDIVSSSPELLVEVGGDMIKPVIIVSTQGDPHDNQVVFNVDSAKMKLKSWSIDVTDDKGAVQHYGPFTNDQESIRMSSILGDNKEGTYQVVMQGETNKGQMIKKESSVHLIRPDETTQKGFRYSILLDFDKANPIASYNKFLTTIVAPAIPDGATVSIHGHTDIVGEEAHNLTLSQQRALDVQHILEHALANAGKNNVKFETVGFGEDASHAPFENELPEQRFYNRTVIIDIVAAKQ